MERNKVQTAIRGISLLLILAGLMLNPKFADLDPSFNIRLCQITLVAIGIAILSANLDILLIKFFSILILFIIIGKWLNFGLIDDAYIIFRYASNFADGHGLVFNVGERVEGYTCFLWTFILGCLKKAGIDIVIAAQIIGVMCGLLIILLSYLFIKEMHKQVIDENPLLSKTTLFILGLNFPLIYWSHTGMETTFHTFLLLCSALFFAKYILMNYRKRECVFSSSLLALASMTRPETTLLFPLNLFFIFVYTRKGERLKNTLISAGIFLLIYGSYFMWRYNYYGWLFPNTYYVKVDHSSLLLFIKGVKYLLRAYISHFLLVIFILLRILREKGLDRVSIYLLSIIIVQCLGIIYVGGDHFPGNRYFVSMVPFLFIIGQPEYMKIALAASRYFEREYIHFKQEIFLTKFIPTLIIMNIGILTFWSSFYLDGNGEVAIGEHLSAENWSRIGKWLKNNAKSTDIVAVAPAGAIPFYSGLRTIDMLGLNDLYIAHKKVKMGKGRTGHEKYDNTYVFSRRPDYIYLGLGKLQEEYAKYALSTHPATCYRDLAENYFPQKDYTIISGSYEETVFSFYKLRE